MAILYHRYDAIIVGAGGSGLSAALRASRHGQVVVLTKLYPTRSHTGTAQGGVGAALGNLEEDRCEWHMFDTVKGSDYLADQDAVEVMCQEAIESVYELEHMGLPFSRTTDGKIAQRRFGGHTRNFGEGPVQRACYAADRTGHMILQTLYQQCIKNGVQFFNEYFVIDLIIHEGRAAGVVAWNIRDGGLEIFHAKAVMFATGGDGRKFKVTSNAVSLTGDGMAIVFRRGIPLEDMEFFQFHPTGIYKLGILLSEAARGEGAVLRNSEGERFMERYAPNLLDLAPRDMVSRCIYREIREGRGIQGKDYVYLDMTHLGREVLDRKLPDITDFVRTYLGIEPAREPVPVQPTAHYEMGGIPTDVDGRVVIDSQNTPFPGLYAAGECACVSVHGANRLGTNSLLDIIVFGRRAGNHIASFIRQNDYPPLPKNPEKDADDSIQRLLLGDGKENPALIRQELQETMMENASVFRNESSLKTALDAIYGLKERTLKATVQDKGQVFNIDLVEAIEVGFLLETAEALLTAALNRKESRGAHYREDFPQRNDAEWLKHTLLYRQEDGSIRIDYKPVVITRFVPKERKY